MAGGDGRGDNPIHRQMGVLHRLGHVADRRAIGQQHVDIHPQPLGMEPARIGHAMRAIQRVVRGLGVQHHPALGRDRLARGGEQVGDVVVLDAPPADIDLDLRGLAGEPRPAAADPHRLQRGIGHFLGALDRVAHGIGGGDHIGDIAALHALRRAMAGAEHHQFAILALPRHHRRNAERADIDRAKHAIEARGCGDGHQFVSRLAVWSGIWLESAALLVDSAVVPAAERPGTRR